MSWVANMLVIADRQDRDVVESLSEWLRINCPWNGPSDPPNATGVGYLRLISDPNGTWGGWKHPECAVWGGVLNHADLDAVLAQVSGLPWRYRGPLQILLMDQEESYFRLYMWRDGGLHQFAPPPPDNADDEHAW